MFVICLFVYCAPSHRRTFSAGCVLDDNKRTCTTCELRIFIMNLRMQLNADARANAMDAREMYSFRMNFMCVEFL